MDTSSIPIFKAASSFLELGQQIHIGHGAISIQP